MRREKEQLDILFITHEPRISVFPVQSPQFMIRCFAQRFPVRFAVFQLLPGIL